MTWARKRQKLQAISKRALEHLLCPISSTSLQLPAQPTNRYVASLTPADLARLIRTTVHLADQALGCCGYRMIALLFFVDRSFPALIFCRSRRPVPISSNDCPTSYGNAIRLWLSAQSKRAAARRLSSVFSIFPSFRFPSYQSLPRSPHVRLAMCSYCTIVSFPYFPVSESTIYEQQPSDGANEGKQRAMNW